MLKPFDWLRRCQTGAELLATLQALEATSDLFQPEEIGPPPSALDGPCQRCWIYPRRPGQPASDGGLPAELVEAPGRYCQTCQTVLDAAWPLNSLSRNAAVVWGMVNQLPRQLREREGFYREHLLSAHLHDEHHFLLMLYKRHLRDWLQELVLYHGADLIGLIQIFPTTGGRTGESMGDLLTRVASQDVHAAPDQLRVRFYAAPYQVTAPHLRDRQGILSFEVAEFLRLLEMAGVFRVLLRPAEQEALRELLTLEDAKEESFYWGRFLGQLSPEAKDMLSAWRLRAWPRERLQLLYELTNYIHVDFSQAH